MMNSLQARLVLVISLCVTLLWLAAAGVTANWLAHDVNRIFDDGLQATARRLLPLAIRDGNRGQKMEEDDDDKRTERPHERGDFDRSLSYLVTDRTGRVLFKSDGEHVNVPDGSHAVGFSNDKRYRYYTEVDDSQGVTISVAEPLSERKALSTRLLLGLALPLVLVIPLSALAIVGAVRRLFRPVRNLRHELEAANAQNLVPIGQGAQQPAEMVPVVGAINQLLGRLQTAFEAERNFAANAAHELRTPVAGAIAQAQRLQAESVDPAVIKRARDIESTLKRLTRTAEKLMQFARAEGGRMILDTPRDVRPILKAVADDFTHHAPERLLLSLPDTPVLSTIEPDALGIMCRNLFENALKHGEPTLPVTAVLGIEGRLSVVNGGPVLSVELLERLQKRFEKADASREGTGLGLSIVRTIAERSGASLKFSSPAPGRFDGVGVQIDLPGVVRR